MMTKVELEDFVREVYASFNQTFYEAEREYVLRAWWNLLKDLEVVDVRRKFLQMAVVAKVMPTPGAIRRTVVESTLESVPPTPQEAWAELQKMIQEVNQGTVGTRHETHSVLSATIRSLGPPAFSLSTNRDRDYFMSVYAEKLAAFYENVYRVEDGGAP